jgi:spore coat protein JB
MVLMLLTLVSCPLLWLMCLFSSGNAFMNRTKPCKGERFFQALICRLEEGGWFDMARASREELMKNYQVMCFFLDDITLYLNSHPTDQAALRSYEKYKRLKDAAAREYTEAYGPLFSDDVSVTDRWTWADMPWPWERQG